MPSISVHHPVNASHRPGMSGSRFLEWWKDMGPGEEEGACPSHSQSRGALPPGHPNSTAHLLFPFFSDTTTAWVCIFLFGVFRLCQRDAAKTWGFTSDAEGYSYLLWASLTLEPPLVWWPLERVIFIYHPRYRGHFVHFGRERSTKLAFSRASRGPHQNWALQQQLWVQTYALDH